MMDRSRLPPPRSFYEQELGELGRRSRGWTTPKAGCPFHPSKSKTSFRVNLDSGAFKCFACAAHGGGVIDYVMQRDRIGFKQAVQELGAWRGRMSSSERRDFQRRKREAQRQRVIEAAQRDHERLKRIAAREHLHACERLVRELAAEPQWTQGTLAAGFRAG